MKSSIIRFINVVLAALLAGVSFGIWLGFNPLHLTPSTFVEQQQNMLRSLSVLMVSLVVLATLITLVSAILQKNEKSVLITLLIAAGFFIACILITRFGNKPIDDIMMSWVPGSLPANWKELQVNWWWFHKIRTISELAALSLITWASIKKE